MKTKTLVVTTVVAAIVALVARYTMVKPALVNVQPTTPVAPQAAPVSTATQLPEPAPEISTAPEVAPAEASATEPAVVKPTKAEPAAASSTPKPKQEIQDPVARVAMSLVGIDPDAEAYWLDAITDPSLPDSEREDLMEDLNESGFSADNGRRATVEDLPIIARRLQLIEEIAPYADDFMVDHLGEAYKDLSQMRDRLLVSN